RALEVHLHDLERLACSNGDGGAGFHGDLPLCAIRGKIVVLGFQVLPPRSTGKATPGGRKAAIGSIFHKALPVRRRAGWTPRPGWPNMAGKHSPKGRRFDVE
ncbi:hypothetical protein PV773_25040, partial [Mesorhizobium sp. CC13]|uniref:hypothetical protein n=1 Tax=Mesorhizobium sp. CC13 TaxID=3029194 RepID=UPI0032668532